MKEQKGIRISVIGAGGIGSNLVCSIAPAISTGPLVKSLGGIQLGLYDSDKVEGKNLRLGQRFCHGDRGLEKVEAIRESLSGYEGELMKIEAFGDDIRKASDLPDSDIVVVCVDNMSARRVVHSLEIPWLDLRCAGDGYIAIDHRVDGFVVSSLTKDSDLSQSCQLDGWESGFLQAGFLAAAAHGYQWLIAMLRKMNGNEMSVLPVPRSTSVTFGSLGSLPLSEVAIDVR
jgi:hypothetical protein|tara:strand:+ start:6552 stop:7241 length:690 start_codon:yes stop_codon:yes gene_type:complete